MHRRHFFAWAGAMSAGLARPAIAQNNTRLLRFVPQANLTHPDALVLSATTPRNSGHMIWDSLYGQSVDGSVHPQMVSGHEVSADGRTWRFTLRDGLLFHDNEPVRASDCVASIQRWGKRRSLGQKLLAETDEMRVIDDKRFEISTKRPFPRLLALLGKDTFFVVLPERMAKNGPLAPITEFVGSGPFRFVANEWEAGARVVYSRFDKYNPRAEPADFLSGGKLARFDRVEWIVMPDPAVAALALQRGEVDWIERPLIDLLPTLRRAQGVQVLNIDPTGAMPIMLFNHLQPPFNNRKLLRALLPAMDQRAFVQAAVGDEPGIGKSGVGFFTPGLGMANDVGMAAVTAPPDLALAKKLVAESGYAGEKLVILSPTDIPDIRAICDVARDIFTKIGLNVDYVSLDRSTLERRRLSREPLDKGGWSMFCITFEGLNAAGPGDHQPLRGNGLSGFFGWPTSPEIEALRDAWFDAPDATAQRKICEDIQRTAWDQVPYMPLGHWFVPTATRANIVDIVKAPFPIFWNARRA